MLTEEAVSQPGNSKSGVLLSLRATVGKFNWRARAMRECMVVVESTL